MARGRKRAARTPPPELALAGDHRFVQVWSSFVTSAAYRDLTDKQARLLFYCYFETHGRAMNDSENGDPLLFYMNRGLYVTYYGLYSKGNESGFRRDMTALIEHGFVDCRARGYEMKDKNLYRLSSRWRLWGEAGFVMPADCMTVHMLNDRHKRMETG